MSTAVFPLSGLHATETPFHVGIHAAPVETSCDFVTSIYDLRAVLLGKPTDYERAVHEENQEKDSRFQNFRHVRSLANFYA
jgi:hypothetical protein